MIWCLLIVIVTTLTACPQTKLFNTLREKGYDTSRDTIDFKPYEYVVINRGFVPTYETCTSTDTLNVKISIKGFESETYLPVKALRDSIQFVLSDPSIKEIVDGTMRLKLTSVGTWHKIKTDSINHTKIQFGSRNNWKFKTIKPNYIVYFFCVSVKKDGKVYTIPSRHYYLTE